MDKKQEIAEKLFQKYMLLSEKTKMECFEREYGKQYEFKPVTVEDMEKLERAKKDLEEYLEYLSENYLRQLYKDEYFVKKAIKIINNRKF